MFAAIIANQPEKRIVAPSPWFGAAYSGTLPEQDLYPEGSTVINYLTGEVRTATR
jgi:hypothetical protein